MKVALSKVPMLTEELLKDLRASFPEVTFQIRRRSRSSTLKTPMCSSGRRRGRCLLQQTGCAGSIAQGRA